MLYTTLYQCVTWCQTNETNETNEVQQQKALKLVRYVAIS